MKLLKKIFLISILFCLQNHFNKQSIFAQNKKNNGDAFSKIDSFFIVANANVSKESMEVDSLLVLLRKFDSEALAWKEANWQKDDFYVQMLMGYRRRLEKELRLAGFNEKVRNTCDVEYDEKGQEYPKRMFFFCLKNKKGDYLLLYKNCLIGNVNLVCFDKKGITTISNSELAYGRRYNKEEILDGHTFYLTNFKNVQESHISLFCFENELLYLPEISFLH